MSKPRILIIEDESAIAEGIAYNLRREGYDVTRAAAAPPATDRLEAGDVVLDTARHEVFVRTQPVVLTPKEFDLLRVLMANRGRVMTRELLLNRVWGEERYLDERTVDVHIRWLRRKIERDASQPLLIQTVRGTGYRFGD